jgi:hypothetical protein
MILVDKPAATAKFFSATSKSWAYPDSHLKYSFVQYICPSSNMSGTCKLRIYSGRTQFYHISRESTRCSGRADLPRHVHGSLMTLPHPNPSLRSRSTTQSGIQDAAHRKPIRLNRYRLDNRVPCQSTIY